MATDPRKRQKQLAKQRKKDAVRRKKAAAVPKFDPVAREKAVLANGARYFGAIECYRSTNGENCGEYSILVVREQEGGYVAFGLFLVDAYLEGVKSAVGRSCQDPLDFRHTTFPEMDERFGLERCDPSWAQNLVYGGVEFAAQFGFRPDPDFSYASGILQPLAELGPCEPIEFGLDGRPCFLGSWEAELMDEIMDKIERASPDHDLFACLWENGGLHKLSDERCAEIEEQRKLREPLAEPDGTETPESQAESDNTDPDK